MKEKSDRPRDVGVDLVRALSVILMILCHSIRGTSFQGRPTWTIWVMALEPLGQVAFLFLLGCSARLSWARNPEKKSWALLQVRRSGVFLVLGAAMVLLERGSLQDPVNLFSGFLALAAKCLIVLLPLGLFTTTGRRVLWGMLAGVLLWGGGGALEWNGLWINGWNAGNGPLLPLAAVAWTGWMVASLPGRFRQQVPLLGILLMCGGILMADLPGDFLDFLAQSGRESVAIGLIQHGRAVQVHYYTLHSGLALFWVGVTAAGVSVLRWVPRAGAGWLLPLGRHSLGVYLAHLAILGPIRLVFGFLSAQWIYALAGGLLLLMVGLSAVLDWYTRQKFLLLGHLRIRSSAG